MTEHRNRCLYVAQLHIRMGTVNGQTVFETHEMSSFCHRYLMYSISITLFFVSRPFPVCNYSFFQLNFSVMGIAFILFLLFRFLLFYFIVQYIQKIIKIFLPLFSETF